MWAGLWIHKICSCDKYPKSKKERILDGSWGQGFETLRIIHFCTKQSAQGNSHSLVLASIASNWAMWVAMWVGASLCRCLVHKLIIRIASKPCIPGKGDDRDDGEGDGEGWQGRGTGGMTGRGYGKGDLVYERSLSSRILKNIWHHLRFERILLIISPKPLSRTLKRVNSFRLNSQTDFYATSILRDELKHFKSRRVSSIFAPST